MYYKPDWEKSKQRILAWWNHEIIDRCCIAVHAPKENSNLPPFPDLQLGPWLGGLDEIDENNQEGIRDWWINPEKNYQRAITWFENTYFGGEALPITYVNWGAMSLATMFGSPPNFNRNSVWYPEVIKDWDSWSWEYNEKWWKVEKDIVERFLEDAPGKYFVGSPELGNGADVLSLLRGMDKLAMDLYKHPDNVKKGVDVISQKWVELMEEVHLVTYDANDDGGVLAWMGLWAPGKIDQIACDFSSIISPDMFCEFFVPEIVRMGNWCDFGTYHLDGPACINNMLDPLLNIDQLKCIQFTPGPNAPPTYTEAYIPEYRKILESGRNLYLLTEPNEVEKILSELPPEGLFMRTYVKTQDKAEEMLKNVSAWTTQ